MIDLVEKYINELIPLLEHRMEIEYSYVSVIEDNNTYKLEQIPYTINDVELYKNNPKIISFVK